MSRDTRCPGQSPSWDGVGCPRTPRFVPGHLRCPRTVLSQDGQLSWDGRRRSRTALLGHQVSRDTTCPWTFFSAPERPPLTPDATSHESRVRGGGAAGGNMAARDRIRAGHRARTRRPSDEPRATGESFVTWPPRYACSEMWRHPTKPARAVEYILVGTLVTNIFHRINPASRVPLRPTQKVV